MMTSTSENSRNVEMVHCDLKWNKCKKKFNNNNKKIILNHIVNFVVFCVIAFTCKFIKGKCHARLCYSSFTTVKVFSGTSLNPQQSFILFYASHSILLVNVDWFLNADVSHPPASSSSIFGWILEMKSGLQLWLWKVDSSQKEAKWSF